MKKLVGLILVLSILMVNLTGVPFNGGANKVAYEVNAQTFTTIESAHNYADNFDQSWDYTVEGAGCLFVFFNSETFVEEDYDFIYIYDNAGDEVYGSPFTGDELSNTMVTVPGDKVKIQLVSDDTSNYYGFKVDLIESDLSEYEYIYQITDNQASIRKYIGESTNFVVPDTIERYPVTRIEKSAFEYTGEALQSILLPETLTTIDSYAFAGCNNLKSITIPASVSSIGDGAFWGCLSLENIHVSIGNFYYSSYNGILFDKLNENLLVCPEMKTGEIALPSSTKSIAYAAFAFCENLTKITLNTGLQAIGDYAFYGCEALTALTIPEGVTDINETIVEGCINLTTLSISSTVSYIGDIFWGLESLQNINVSAANSYYKSIGGVLFSKNGTTLLNYPIGKTGSYSVPTGVLEISDFAFYGALLSSVVLNNQLSQIGESAFAYCIGLASISIPASVTYIGDYAFDGCDTLKNAYFYGNAPQIREDIFWGTPSGFYVNYLTGKTGFSSGLWLDYNRRLFYQNFTVTFNSMSGSAVTAKTANSGSAITAPTSPTRAGYYFAGWYTSSGYTTPWNFATSKVTANTTLYAKWIATATTGLKVVSAGYNALRLTWTAVSGATNYEIYRATSSAGAYALVATTLASAGGAYTNVGLPFNTTYYYKVRAYSLNGTVKTYSGYSAIAYAKTLPLAPASVVASSPTYNSIKISWAAVTGASGYSVYRSTTATGTFTLLSSVTTAYYTNSSLTPGATYYYKVAAYRLVGTTKVYGPQCAAVGKRVVPPIITSFTAVRYSATSIKLTWGAISGASGYELYRSTALAGTYTLLKAQTALTYTNTTLKTGTTYYYKVRPYRMVGTTKVYGDFSAVKYAKP